MSPTPNPNPEKLPSEAPELDELNNRISRKRQQIAALQRELDYLEQRQRELKLHLSQKVLKLTAFPPVEPMMDVDTKPMVLPERIQPDRVRRAEILLLGLLVLAAFVIRVYQLGTFPDTVLADEADNAQDSVRILYGLVPQNGLFGLDWTSQPAFSAYKEAGFIALFGFTAFAIRLSSALISTLTLIPFYFLLRRQLSVTASLLATLLLATNVWYLNFSRSGWNCIDTCFYMLMAMLFLMRGIDAIDATPRAPWIKWIPFAFAGFFCAMGLYGYPAGRAITLATAAFFPIAWLFHRQQFKSILLGYTILFVVEAIVFAPEGIYVAKNWDHFNGRSNVVLIFNNPDFQADPTGTMLKQLSWNIRAPWDGRVNNTPQYSPAGEPQLERITGWLALLGMGLTFLVGNLRKRSETWLWWLMMLVGWGLTQLFTVNTPNGARGIGYMPTLFYFAGISLNQIILALNHVFTKFSTSIMFQRLSVAVLCLLILFTGYGNVRHYIDWQTTPHTRLDRYLYVTTQEFPEWSAAIVGQAKNNLGIINVGQWRETHPIENLANPYGISP